MMATVPEMAYAAGLIDGEGTIALPARVAVKMTDPEPIRFMHTTFGGRKYQWKDTKSGRQLHEWRLNGLAECVDLFSEIAPFSLVKKRQMDILTSYYEYKSMWPEYDIRGTVRMQLRSCKSKSKNTYSVWDIETTGLDAANDTLLAFGMYTNDWPVKGSQPYADGRTQPDDELSLAMHLRGMIESAPFTVGWNSTRFDIPFLNKRLAAYKTRPVFIGSHDDAKYMYGNGRRSLADAAEELELVDDDAHKTPIHWPTWERAAAGDWESMEYILDHARKDVVLTDRVYRSILGSR
jgi:hypothetical protein